MINWKKEKENPALALNRAMAYERLVNVGYSKSSNIQINELKQVCNNRLDYKDYWKHLGFTRKTIKKLAGCI